MFIGSMGLASLGAILFKNVVVGRPFFKFVPPHRGGT